MKSGNPRNALSLDANTFVQLYFPLQKTIREIATRLLQDPIEADDVAQEVFLKLWEQRDKLGEIESPEAYAVTMTKNKCLDTLRTKAYKNQKNELPPETTTQLSTTTETPINYLIAQEQEEILKKWIATLPPQQQEVFKLRHMQLLTNTEIAEKMGLQEVTVRSMVSRLRKEARKLFQD